jgi:TetR/AcrR family transcriptional repressor of nem operon
MGRPKAFDFDTVLDAAMQTFWRQGYDGTSVSDLVTATGINRGSLYGTFGDKNALFADCLDRYCREIVSDSIADLEAPDAAKVAIVTRFDRFAQACITDPDAKGCFLVNTATEIGDRVPAVNDRVKAGFQRIEDALFRALSRAADRDEIPLDLDLRATARFLLASLQGMRVVARFNPDPNVLRDIARMAVSVLDRS